MTAVGLMMRSRYMPGVLLLLAGAFILMGIITAETQYPIDVGYTTAQSEISDLGATRPPNSIVTQPSATIFNVAMMVSGAMIALGAVALRDRYRRRALPYTTMLLGLGILFVGIFPGDKAIHPLVAMTTFLAGGVTCLVASRVTDAPFRFVSLALGVTSLVFLFLASNFIPLLGDGGTERWVAYPVVLWLVAFGGYLLGASGTDGIGDVSTRDAELVGAES